MTIEDSYNFRRIRDGLTTSGVVSVEQLGELQREGYDAVINLMPDSESPVEGEARIVQEQGLDYVYIPVDFNAPTRADFDAFVEAMDAHASGRVHVHCAANFRVTAFVSLYALRRGWCTEGEANELVRSVWDPAEFPAWSTFITDERAAP
jgi:protein tyrosine phosphatase (PTP) superfamily phosphohydrolase (DUF442 family)